MHVEVSEQALQCMICLCEKALQWCDLLFQACSPNSTQTAAELQRDTERATRYNATHCEYNVTVEQNDRRSQ